MATYNDQTKEFINSTNCITYTELAIPESHINQLQAAKTFPLQSILNFNFTIVHLIILLNTETKRTESNF